MALWLNPSPWCSPREATFAARFWPPPGCASRSGRRRSTSAPRRPNPARRCGRGARHLARAKAAAVAAAARAAGAWRRPDPGARQQAFQQAGRSGRRGRAAAGLARPHPRTAFRAGSGARRQILFALCRHRAADHARFLRRLSRGLSRHGGRTPALTSVGGYQLEGIGIHLFERVEGDYFTILGLPLLPLLGFLRQNKFIDG